MNGTTWLMLLLLLVAGGHAVHGVATGTVYHRLEPAASRADEPVKFWAFVACDVALALLAVVLLASGKLGRG